MTAVLKDVKSALHGWVHGAITGRDQPGGRIDPGNPPPLLAERKVPCVRDGSPVRVEHDADPAPAALDAKASHRSCNNLSSDSES